MLLLFLLLHLLSLPSAVQRLEHFIPILKIRPTSAMIRALVRVNVLLMLIAVKRFCEAYASDIARELLHVCIQAPLIID